MSVGNLVQADVENLKGIFSGNYVFEIPMYQRAYDWGIEEVSDFCFDIKEARDTYESGSSGAPIERLFFGSIVAVKPDEDWALGARYFLIDGQQRLTTFYLTLSLIVEELEEIEVGLDEIDGDLIYKVKHLKERINRCLHLNGDPEQSTLKLSKTDDDFFSKLLETPIGQEVPGKARERLVSHVKLAEARVHISENLVCNATSKGAEENKVLLDLKERFLLANSLMETLTEGIEVVFVMSKGVMSQHKLFMGLNNRGKPLSDMDLLRVRTMQGVFGDQDKETTIFGIWEQIRSGPGVDRRSVQSIQKSFLKVFYPSHIGSLDMPILSSFADRWIVDKSAMAVNEFVETFRDDYMNYSYMHVGESPYGAKNAVTGAVDGGDWEKTRLNELVKGVDHKAAHPLILALVSHQKERFTMDVVEAIGKFSFRFKAICNENITPAQLIYYNHSLNVRAGTFNISDFKKELQGLLDEKCNDLVFREKIKTTLEYGTSNHKIRYFLNMINSYWASNREGDKVPKPSKELAFDSSEVHIEHIFPRSVNDGSAESIRRDKIENLTLWAARPNQAAQASIFEEKKEKYKDSGFAITSNLTRYEKWDSEAMEERGKLLLHDACKIFRM